MSPRAYVFSAGLVTAVALAPGCADVSNSNSPFKSMETSFRTISPSESSWSYEGRLDFADRASPVVIWQGTRLRFGFEGPVLVLKFENVNGQSFFNLEIDGHTTLISVRDPGVQRLEVATGLKHGRHVATLFKRSEAAAGYVRFLGAEIAHGAGTFLPESPKTSAKFQFFGDSITAGACNEDPGEDQWEDRSTHNNAESYGALVAKTFHADYRNIAVSGMGVCEGYVEVRAPEVWDRVYPIAKSEQADLHSWQPDILFVNLGENDDSFTKNQGRAFPVDFAARYVAMLQEMRKHYPRAHIVLLRGGMGGGANSEPLRLAWTKAVETLESVDPLLTHFVFKHWSGPHPRVADDRAMADELTAWLRLQSFAPALAP